MDGRHKLVIATLRRHRHRRRRLHGGVAVTGRYPRDAVHRRLQAAAAPTAETLVVLEATGNSWVAVAVTLHGGGLSGRRGQPAPGPALRQGVTAAGQDRRAGRAWHRAQLAVFPPAGIGGARGAPAEDPDHGRPRPRRGAAGPLQVRSRWEAEPGARRPPAVVRSRSADVRCVAVVLQCLFALIALARISFLLASNVIAIAAPHLRAPASIGASCQHRASRARSAADSLTPSPFVLRLNFTLSGVAG